MVQAKHALASDVVLKVPLAQIRHVGLLVCVHEPLMYKPSPHVAVHNVHIRSDVAVSKVLAYEVKLQGKLTLQTRSDVVVNGTLSYRSSPK